MSSFLAANHQKRKSGLSPSCVLLNTCACVYYSQVHFDLKPVFFTRCHEYTSIYIYALTIERLKKTRITTIMTARHVAWNAIADVVVYLYIVHLVSAAPLFFFWEKKNQRRNESIFRLRCDYCFVLLRWFNVCYNSKQWYFLLRTVLYHTLRIII